MRKLLLGASMLSMCLPPVLWAMNWLRLPGAAVLFVGGSETVRVVTAASVADLPSAAHYASLSRDGKTVATAIVKYSPRNTSEVSLAREAVGTYSLPSQRWIEYAEMHSVFSVSISPDGSALAIVGEPKYLEPLVLCVLNTVTRRCSAVPDPDRPRAVVSDFSAPSWSPDGKHLAFETVDRELKHPAIFVAEERTGKTWKVADGQAPAWSPSGEWIAYLNWTAVASGSLPGATECRIVRPDGAGDQTLVAAPHGKGKSGRFLYAPVWSPDSTRLLLSEVVDYFHNSMNIDLFDLASRRLTTRARKTAPILGWAAIRGSVDARSP
jgi:hypothetical protein